MDLNLVNLKCATTLTIIIYAFSLQTKAVRLNTIIESLKGTLNDSTAHGFLHVGHQYSVFILKPKPGQKELIYQLYQTKNKDEPSQIKPTVLAVSKIPVEYLLQQLQMFKKELATVKHGNKETIPGTQVLTLREWQIKEALNDKSHHLRIDVKHDISTSRSEGGMPLPTLE